MQNQLVYLFILTLTVGFVSFNIVNPDKPGALENQIPKTIMAQLIPTEFESAPNEQLIEETQTPSNVSPAAPEKYSNSSCVLDKATSILIEEETEQSDLLSFNDVGDTVFKPRIIGLTAGNTETTLAQRTTIIYYTVQNGDTVSTIARRFGLTVNTILWANNLTAYSLIRPGDSLTILPYSGVLYTVKSGDTVSKIASRYGVDGDKISSCNDVAAGLKVGQKIVIPGAKKITTQTSVAQTSNSGLSIIKDLIKAPAVRTSGSKMIWPTAGYRITQYFSWRHTGVDIANRIGTPIYAADDGVVEIARGGYNGGYGNTIVINHGGGVKTRYGHASKLFVKVGDEVEKGENIAAMGSTGRSTGPHLHFEVLINGARYNPLNYIR